MERSTQLCWSDLEEIDKRRSIRGLGELIEKSAHVGGAAASDAVMPNTSSRNRLTSPGFVAEATPAAKSHEETTQTSHSSSCEVRSADH